MKKSAIIVSTILICHSLVAVEGRDWEDLSEVARHDVVSNLVYRQGGDFVGVFQCRADELYHMKEWSPEESGEPYRNLLLNAGYRIRVIQNFEPRVNLCNYGYVFGSENYQGLKIERRPSGSFRKYRPRVDYSLVTYFAVLRVVRQAGEIIENPIEAEKISPAVEKGVAYKLVPGCCFEVEAEPYQVRMEGWPDIEKKRVENIISSHQRMVSMGQKGSYVALVRLSKRELSEAIYCLFGKRRYNELLSGGSNPYLIEIAGGIPETQFARDIYFAMKARRTKKGKK